MSVTLKHVAQRAGVSRSAVSRCFTEGASISAATRAKVERAAAELGYSPNFLARSLTTGQFPLTASASIPADGTPPARGNPVHVTYTAAGAATARGLASPGNAF